MMNGIEGRELWKRRGNKGKGGSMGEGDLNDLANIAVNFFRISN